MEETFRTGEPVFIDGAAAPAGVRGFADRVRRDDGEETVDLAGLGQVPRTWVQPERRSNRNRPRPSSSHSPG